jgi:hypothetical protein
MSSPKHGGRRLILTDFTSLIGGSLSPEARARLDLSVSGRNDYWEALITLAECHRLTAALWSALLREGLATPPPQALRPFLPENSIVLRLEGDWRFNG